MSENRGETLYLYVGTYTEGESEGIYVYRMHSITGALELASITDAWENPTFLAIHPQRRYLYAVNEISEFDGKAGGSVSAFAIDQTNGELTFLNRKSSVGDGPCHLVVDSTGNYVLAANYGGGSVCMLPILDDGRLGDASDFVQHEGSSADSGRQSAPHAHSIVTDPANQYAFAPDLGLDKIKSYRLDLTAGKLVPNAPPHAAVAAGAGPRHFDFHPNRRFAYVINELDSTITGFDYDESSGTLSEIQTISTLPEDFSGKSHTADVHVHLSGRFLYGSNRGHDSIAIFEIDETSGRLRLIGYEPTQGETPRNFGIDPSGTILLAANQNTDTIVTFQIDQETGNLNPTGQVIEVPAPVCLQFVTLS
ncbi:MAG: lactonase family protein [Candidatus Poribacteria bacterium]|nr:lactonase family protein [Candidatus Poribacteria bacterium]